MIFDKMIDSNVEWVGLNGRNRENQVKEKTMEVRVASNMLGMFPNDTQENDCATSYEDLKSLHAEYDDEDLLFLLQLDIWIIQNLSLRLIWFSAIAKNSSEQLSYMLC